MGERLSISGLNVAYGMTEYPTNGPFITDVMYGSDFAHLTYDQDFVYTPIENSGFYWCSVAGGPDVCDNTNGSWVLVIR